MTDVSRNFPSFSKSDMKVPKARSAVRMNSSYSRRGDPPDSADRDCNAVASVSRTLLQACAVHRKEEIALVFRIRKTRVVRRNHVDPQEKPIGEFGEDLARLLETCCRAVAHREIGGHPPHTVPYLFEVMVFVDATANS